MMLESESESKFFGNTGIGINCCWNRNWNQNHVFRKTLESESESESTLVESELESESLVPESFTTLTATVQHETIRSYSTSENATVLRQNLNH